MDQIDATSACRTGAVKPTSFPPSVVITDAVGELHLWCWPMGPTWLENKDASSSGRLVLRDQRHRNICQPFCRINLILALAGLARKPVWSDITVTTSSGFLAASFSVSVEAHRRAIAKFQTPAVVNNPAEAPGEELNRLIQTHRVAGFGRTISDGDPYLIYEWRRHW